MAKQKQKEFKRIVRTLIGAHVSANPNFIMATVERQEFVVKNACEIAAMLIKHTKAYRKKGAEFIRNESIEVIPFVAEETGEM